MSMDAANLQHLLERVIQMHAVLIGEMNEQRKQYADQQAEQRQQYADQQAFIASRLRLPSPTLEDASDAQSLRSVNKIHIKPKEFNGTSEENVITWLSILEEVLVNQSTSETERVSVASTLLGGTASQWFVNLKTKNLRPSTWDEFKEQIIAQFQPRDFQEQLRRQLSKLRQKQSMQDYISAFRSIVGQIDAMDELTQIMLFTDGLSMNTSLYVQSKHPKTLEDAIREATTYDNIITINKNHQVKYDPFLESSSSVELNAISSQQRLSKSYYSGTSKEDCFKYGLCFYCKEPGHRAFKCPKKSQKQSATTSTYSKNDQR